MRFIERKEYTFVPDMEVVDENGKSVKNKELPKSKQISAVINRPDSETRAELKEIEVARTYSKKEVGDANKGSDSDSVTKKKLNFMSRMDVGRILREHVLELKNVEIEVQDGEGKQVKVQALSTGADLAECKAFGIEVLVQKLCAEVLRDKLDEKTEKNSEPQPSSM